MKPSTDIVLLSPLSIEQCAQSLGQALGREDWFDYGSAPIPGWKSVVGKIEGNSFRLHRRKYALWYRDYFVPAFWGNLESQPSGTRIEGDFHLAPYALVGMGAWLALATTMFVLLSIPAIVAIITGRKVSDGVWEEVVLPPIAVLLGLVLPRWTRWWHSEDRAIILDFLCNTLSATVDASSKAR